VLYLLFVSREAVATLTLFASLAVPSSREELHRLIIVVVHQTLVVFVFRVVIDIFEVEELSLLFNVLDSSVVLDYFVCVVYCRNL